MECLDRIAVRWTESVLRPIHLLGEQPSLTGVTVRTFWSGRRYNLAISKAWPSGACNPPAYEWEVWEVEEDGKPKAGGLHRTGEAACADPEEAYWCASECAPH